MVGPVAPYSPNWFDVPEIGDLGKLLIQVGFDSLGIVLVKLESPRLL